MDENRQKLSADTPAGEMTPLKKQKGFFRELLEFAIITVIIVVPFRIYVAQPYVVNGASMDPTFKTGDYLIVDELTYRFSPPVRGSVLIFKYPKDTRLFFIKRVIGLPGETINIKGGIVTITKTDGTTETLNEPYVEFTKVEDYSITLTPDQYFVLGDNRVGSADSRIWGPMPKEDIIGRPVLRLLPLSKLGTIPGDETGQLSSAK